ncbi:50S ribosomal protein L3 N(5)-glutamine methyltransferase [Bordetella genomosp. 9]|uniref:Ribosomal protein uL3 glutamine methyltransferase n=1 Tax=Bordetella genomosp. 9 TaxID=1416803 RepID=A0A1W6YZ71_9BORD|nr:50S ribosomal protein L3 N(5)-glutamine methyltransferase [Bordetella genomosp. 9]ARP86254.1 50S ribosomal protein L3 N(5)-glutamine methyltransferase [Bordetella genomosp. 9]ARP92589.1 50S ribosomal protein L3 N(5)-glutamine methyltransferase [Bordetella genomosp. 9]
MSATDRQELQTVRDLVRYGVSRLNGAKVAFGHGSDNAWDEAVYLVLHALHLPLDTLEPFLDARVLPGEREQVLALIDRRVGDRMPAPYLTNEAWLRGRRFYVDNRVIVPRSPIAELLDDSLSPWVSNPETVEYVLDMCTGSGCLAVLSALAFPFAHVDGVDISPSALEVAMHNVEAYNLHDRVSLHAGDLFEKLPPRQYDVIVCNPPYVNAGSMEALPEEYRHEPALALAGGDDGMDLVRRILKDAPAYLKPGGLLVLEIGHERPHFEAAFPNLEPVWLDSSEASDQIVLLTREQLAP